MLKKILLSCLLFVAMVFQTDVMAGRQWHLQPVGATQYGIDFPMGGSTAIGMRSGHAWPIVVSELNTAAMVPGGWVNTGQGMHIEHHSYIDADTSSDGQRTIFATSSGRISTFGPNGWSHSALPSEPHNIRNSVAFDRQDNASMLHLSHAGDLTLSTQRNGLWQSSRVNQNYNIDIDPRDSYALAYDSYNQAHIIASDGSMGVYGTKGVLTQQQWNFQHGPGFDPFGDVEFELGHVLDMELNGYDVPYIAHSAYDNLMLSSFDRMTGRWLTNAVGNIVCDNSCMASDSQGGIGLAYVSDFSLGRMDDIGLSFLYIDADGNVTNEEVPLLFNTGWDALKIEIMMDMGIGLAFDENDNPVISFADYVDGSTWIAYDPVPEPATCLLLLSGGLGVLRSRKK